MIHFIYKISSIIENFYVVYSRNNISISRFFFFSLFLVFLGCGYNFEVKKQLPNNIRTVFLEPFKNNTDTFGLGSLFTNKLTKLLARYSLLVTKNRLVADAILQCEVISLYTERVSCFEENNTNISKRKLIAEIELDLKDKIGTSLWSSGKIAEDVDYTFIFDDIRLSKTKREEAITILINKLSVIAFQMLTERF